MTKERFTVQIGETTNLVGEATIDSEGYCTKIRLITKVQRGHYYSCLNDLLEAADKLFKFKN